MPQEFFFFSKTISKMMEEGKRQSEERTEQWIRGHQRSGVERGSFYEHGVRSMDSMSDCKSFSHQPVDNSHQITLNTLTFVPQFNTKYCMISNCVFCKVNFYQVYNYIVDSLLYRSCRWKFKFLCFLYFSFIKNRYLYNVF